MLNWFRSKRALVKRIKELEHSLMVVQNQKEEQYYSGYLSFGQKDEGKKVRMRG